MSKRPGAPAAARTVALVTHSHPDQTKDAVQAALAAAQNASARLVTSDLEAKKLGEVAGGIDHEVELPADVDVCLALGGDGTILQALRRYADTGVPVFGINFGTIGFLAAVTRDRLDEGLERALSGDFETLELPGLVSQLEIEHPVAVNDITFIRKPHGRVAELSYRLGGEEVGHVRCDGLVAATPVGSTGYNLANQGPILAWGVEGFVVSFIAPHTLTARPLVVAPDDVLHISNQRGREPVDIAFDGRPVGELASGDELAVGFRDGAAVLAQLPGANFYHRIREKFGGLAG
jgi:NAD+ kinase